MEEQMAKRLVLRTYDVCVHDVFPAASSTIMPLEKECILTVNVKNEGIKMPGF